MLLRRVTIENFKLLEDITLDFSIDPERPLTVIRGENSSGKTSLLKAMLWGFYGKAGLPKADADARFTSTATPSGTSVSVRVMLEFEHDTPGGRGRYRIIRSCEETPGAVDEFDRSKERVAAYQITDAGEEAIDDPDVFLRRVIPINLKDIFFTNGDDVQSFMSGRVDRSDRQGRVHKAIKDLLNLEKLYVARNDITEADKRCRKALSKDGGTELAAIATKLEAAEIALDTHTAKIADVDAEISRIRDRVNAWEERLRSFTDIGDLNTINSALSELDTNLAADEAARDGVLRRFREDLESERLSWAVMPDALTLGMDVLQGLHDRGIIPGTAIEVLNDRLLDESCFCGADLSEGTDARARVQKIVDEHGDLDTTKEQLTAAYHSARNQKATQDARAADGEDFVVRRTAQLGELTTITDRISTRRAKREQLLEQRANIDAEQVATLTSDIKSAEADILQRDRDQAVRRHDLASLDASVLEATLEFRKLERQADLSDGRRANANVSDDLKQLVSEVIRDLEEDHVQAVAELMSLRFLEIVGSDPNFDSAIFGSVTITPNFDIEVRTPNGNLLDFDAEINGASQRALTLSFIWALMEVAQVESPRIIDTPLGMVAGNVKTRLTESITKPSTSGTNYQVVLLLTRSEIRDVEQILDNGAGITRTLTASKDIIDLKYPWGHDRPRVKVCTCSHRQTCRICARTYDLDGGFEHRDTEATSA